jgi:glycerol-3-phosphate acyltransferase PlsX
VGARNVIGMGDSPVGALRRKRGSSIEEAVQLVRRGEASAVVSAGNTGACVAAATILLGLLPLVKRAGIAVTFYAGDRPMVMIDVGANVSSKSEHLIQYGVMASLYARKILGMENPRVALLNIGQEGVKGNRLVKETHPLFQRTGLNFVGNIEGGEIFRGGAEVVVCDGFTGNIVLKVSEGLAERLVDLFKTAVEQAVLEMSESAPSGVRGGEGRAGVGGDSRWVMGGVEARLFRGGEMSTAELFPTAGPPVAAEVQALLCRSLGYLRQRLDYAEFGGAQLLGVKGVIIISHGRSDARAICNAVRMAKRMAEANINRHITEEIQAFSAQKVS